MTIGAGFARVEYGLALLIVLLTGGPVSPAAQSQPEGCSPETEYTAFTDPQPVTLRGYSGDAMEPFLARDGELLFFNNRNDPVADTDLHWARRVDDITFDNLGPLDTANSAALDGVPAMDQDGSFYFVSTRSYGRTLSTIYMGQFDDGEVTDVLLVSGLSRRQAGWVNFDVEVSADGDTLYFVDGQFGDGSVPETADLVIATRQADGSFERLPDSAALLAHVNTDQLEYAAAISGDERELFFTRVDPALPVAVPQIYRADRAETDAPFGCPQRVTAITGFAEAPTISADGAALYYHRLDGDRFRLYRVARPDWNG